MGHKYSSDDRAEQIKQAIAHGANYVEDIVETMGIAVSTIQDYARRKGIKLPPFKDPANKYSAKTDSMKDELIKKGLKLEAIAHRFGINRETVRQYILATGQYELYRQARKQREDNEKQRDQILGTLINQIELAGLRNASEVGRWAHEKTKEYFSKKKLDRGVYTSNQIFSLLQDYYRVLENNEKISSKKFGDKYRISSKSVCRIFSNLGLKPLVKGDRKKRVVTSKNKKQALERAIEIEMNCYDISYFLGVPYHIVTQFFYSHYKGDKKRPNVGQHIKRFGALRSGALNYRTASQIYEARDAGFSIEETLELLEKDERVYGYALEHELEISEHIINNLRIMFPDKKITKPYITFSFN